MAQDEAHAAGADVADTVEHNDSLRHHYIVSLKNATCRTVSPNQGCVT
jgi:hypothetical protein